MLLKKYSLNDTIPPLLFKNVEKIGDFDDQENYYVHHDDFLLTYEKVKHSWYLDDKKLKIRNIFFTPRSQVALLFDNCYYEGEIVIKIDENCIYIINYIDIEAYVASVVSHEVYAGWPAEALKAAAVTARTYAMHKLEESTKRNSLFHIKSSIEHQKYKGLTTDMRIHDAVGQTKGKIIMYQQKPILAMYHVCCGGVIPIECVGFDFQKCPYLKRKKKCTGCEDYKYYHWKNNIKSNIICDKLSCFIGKKVIKIKNIKKATYAKSGTIRRLCLEIQIINKNNKKEIIQVLLNNKDLRKIFDIQLSLYSSCFQVNFNNKLDVEINGRGHGHHIGLCQRGMHGYSKQGLSMEKILEFYYPHTTIGVIEG